MPNQDERFVAGMAHVAVLFSALGLALNIGLLVYYRERSRFIAAHIRQALALQVLSIILSWTVGLYVVFAGFGFGFGRIGPHFFFGKAMLTGLFLFLINGVKLALVILGAIRGFGGQEYRQPLIGNLIAGIGE
ncbi:MAG: DUF4870 domain-containing protein [Bacillota bacterium]